MATEPMKNPKIASFPASKIAPLLRVLEESDRSADPDNSRLRAADRVAANLATHEETRDD